MKKLNVISIVLFLLVCSNIISAFEKPDRRRDQYPTNPAYLILPLPYSYPGIGDGVILLANASNLFGTTTDGFIMEVTGDATGRIAHVSELPLINERLFLTGHFQAIDSAVVNNYETRGMENSSKNDYTLLEVDKADSNEISLKYTSQERRYSFYVSHKTAKTSLTTIRDSDGDIISLLAEPYVFETKKTTVGFELDYTDDYLDPRKGVKFAFYISDNPSEAKVDPNFYTSDTSILYYKPMREADTLVLNYYQSDAHVQNKGNINPTDVQKEIGLNCDGGNDVCEKTQQELTNMLINQRTNGTASSLGGVERLRSFPEGRYEGGHAAFLGAEYRWNLTSEATPFNYLFWKDIRTGKQVAFFAEMGSVSEKASDLWDEQEFSAGVGFRLLSASGSVYRADIAQGKEGAEVAIFFEYPWK